MSVIGPSTTSLGKPRMSVSGGEAVVSQTSAEIRFWDPQETLTLAGPTLEVHDSLWDELKTISSSAA